MRIAAVLICGLALAAAQDDGAWTRPFPAHRIAGNLYYAGTEDLACFVVATPAGHILINTGLAGSVPGIRESFRSLGLRLEDVKILLTMQGHFDHVAAMSEVKKLTGARLLATAADAPILEDGGKSDPYFGVKERFAPVKVDGIVKDGDTVRLGNAELRVLETPGHSKGSVSYTMTVEDGGVQRRVAIVNINTVVMPLAGNRKYPGIVGDYERSFEKQKGLSPEIWVAAHASQYRMREKFKAGSFVDPAGYREAIRASEASFRERLRKERGR